MESLEKKNMKIIEENKFYEIYYNKISGMIIK